VYERERIKNISINKKKVFLRDKLIRPIDTIKHQAKTVTVGATRSDSNLNQKNTITNFKDEYGNKIFKNINVNTDLKKKINLIAAENLELQKYYISNIIEFLNSQNTSQKKYNFRGLQEKLVNKSNITNIILHESEIKNKQIKNNISINFNKKLIIGKNKKIKFKDAEQYFFLLKAFLKNGDIKNKLTNSYLSYIKTLENNKSIYKFNISDDIKKFNNIKFLGS